MLQRQKSCWTMRRMYRRSATVSTPMPMPARKSNGRTPPQRRPQCRRLCSRWATAVFPRRCATAVCRRRKMQRSKRPAARVIRNTTMTMCPMWTTRSSARMTMWKKSLPTCRPGGTPTSMHVFPKRESLCRDLSAARTPTQTGSCGSWHSSMQTRTLPTTHGSRN